MKVLGVTGLENPGVPDLKLLGRPKVFSAFQRLPGITGDLVVKSKLSPRGCSAAFRYVNPTHRKGNFF